MNFADNGRKNNISGLIVVILAHVLVFGLIVQSMNSRIFSKPTLPTFTTVIPAPPHEPPPPPKKLELAVKDVAPPPIYIPTPEVKLEQVDKPNTVRSTDNKEEAAKPQLFDKPVEAKLPPTPPALPAKPVKITAVVDARACEKPEYPKNAMRNQETGTVALAMLIGVDGKVVESRIEKSSGSRALDSAAQQGLSLCKFKPATVDGVPEQAWTKMEYVWKIE